MDALTLLENGKAIIEPIENWGRKKAFQYKNGVEAPIEKAARFCATGALDRALFDSTGSYDDWSEHLRHERARAEEFLCEAVSEISPQYSCVEGFNDASHYTRAEGHRRVMNAYSLAIEKARQSVAA